MLFAAAINFLIVYFLFAFKKPLDKIENAEGVFEAVGVRQLLYLFVQVSCFLLGRAATALLMSSKYARYKIDIAYPIRNTTTEKELLNMTVNAINEIEEDPRKAAKTLVA